MSSSTSTSSKPRRKPSATLIGAFAVGGIVLVLAAVIAAGGGKLFARKERVVMHFSGSIYGLAVGAPVVFRGVRLGNVSSIGLVYDQAKDEFIIPVMADLEPEAIRGMAPRQAGRNDGRRTVLEQMVARGLKAQLSMQSLLTGQLYVDLDLRPNKPAVLRGGDEDDSRLEIPTTTTTIQQLKNQLDGLDLRRLVDDVSAIAESARTVVAGPQLKQAMNDLVAITGNVRRITAALDQKVPPLASTAQQAMTSADHAFTRMAGTADGVKDSAAKVGTAADRFREVVQPNSPLVQSLQRTADELAQAAAALHQQVGEDSPVLAHADKALEDVSRAARAVRELADLLSRHPDALLRGKPADPLAIDKTLKPKSPP
ncbi:MlaD family protein [Pelomonas sp. KK5]|uniref:MlaD family protein n=1 Tax=Pelomonas sp. KK5 TaxID=1855730 RepID=UPI00097BBAA7|nr:MlaD family protein [Pelomonas sp. KK5]